jgi:hypothetical protein
LVTNIEYLDLSKVYQPHPKQAEYHAVDVRTKVLEAARRSGKSYFGRGELYKAYQKAYNQKRNARMHAVRFHAWIVVPTFAQGQQSWNEMMDLFPEELLRDVREVAFDQSDKRVYLKGSPNWGDPADPSTWGYGLIEIKSAHDPETLQTVGLDFLWIQEAADIKERAFGKLLPSTRSPGRLGLRVYEGIPALYDDHWFAKQYDLAMRRGTNGTGELSMLAVKMTYKDNPLMDDWMLEEIEIEDREGMTDATWNRMYLAIRSKSAAYFKKIDGCIRGDLLDSPISGRQYVAGLDLGRSVDPSEMLIGDKEGRNVVAWYQWENVPWTQQREEIKAIHEEWSLEEIIFDATAMGGAMARDDFSEMGLPVRPIKIIGGAHEYDWEKETAGRVWLLEQLARDVERNTVAWPHTVELLARQLRQMQERKVGRGTVRVDHPEGEHDDLMWALQFMLMGCEEPAPISNAGVMTDYNGSYLPHPNGDDRMRVSNFRMARRFERDEEMMQRAVEAGVEIA